MLFVVEMHDNKFEMGKTGTETEATECVSITVVNNCNE